MEVLRDGQAGGVGDVEAGVILVQVARAKPYKWYMGVAVCVGQGDLDVAVQEGK